MTNNLENILRKNISDFYHFNFLKPLIPVHTLGGAAGTRPRRPPSPWPHQEHIGVPRHSGPRPNGSKDVMKKCRTYLSQLQPSPLLFQPHPPPPPPLRLLASAATPNSTSTTQSESESMASSLGIEVSLWKEEGCRGYVGGDNL